MVLFALLIGVVLIVAAIRNSHSTLFTAIATDVPQFVVWGAAIVAVGAVGFIPGMKPVSRGLLALILVVLILQNYKSMIKGFENAWQHPPEANPTGAVVDNSKAGPGIAGSPSIGDLFRIYQSAGVDGGFGAGHG